MQHDNYIAELEFGKPQIDDQAFVAPTAVVVGAVTMGPHSSIWYGAVARADADAIEASRWLGLGDTGGLRVGLAPYSDKDDVDRLLAGLREFLSGQLM